MVDWQAGGTIIKFVATEGQFAGLYFRVISQERILITAVAPCPSVAALALYIRFIRRTIPSKSNIVYIGPLNVCGPNQATFTSVLTSPAGSPKILIQKGR
jgi:hypothetical protein